MGSPGALKDLRIAYEPISGDLKQPADRRRFCSYAARRGLQFSTKGETGKTDVVVLSQLADLSKWVRNGKANTKVIFDFIDSYLAEDPWSFRPLFRGVAKFAFRRTRYLWFSYRKLLVEVCRLADAVICATEEQKAAISPFCPNVHVILDFQEKDVTAVKRDYSRGPCFNILWEGLPGNLVMFRELAGVLEQLQSRHPFALHLITDLCYPIGLYNLLPRPTKRLARDVFGHLSSVYLYEWNRFMFSHIATVCDMAVIPTPMNVGNFVGKPANKLLLFWRMGLPVLTSPTPAYRRAMVEAGLDMTCVGPEEWLNKLESYMQNEGARKRAGQLGMHYAKTYYNDESIARQWDTVFDSVGFPVK